MLTLSTRNQLLIGFVAAMAAVTHALLVLAHNASTKHNTTEG